MNKQLSLLDHQTDEEAFYEKIYDQLREVLVKNNAPTDSVTFTKNKGYYSLTYRSNIIFKLSFKENNQWIEIPQKFEQIVTAHNFSPDSQKAFLRLLVMIPEDAHFTFAPLFADLLDAAIDSYPKEFSCCSRYVECSDAKMCIHPDPHSAMNCYYRINLKKGKIFYGKNSIIEGN